MLGIGNGVEHGAGHGAGYGAGHWTGHEAWGGHHDTRKNKTTFFFNLESTYEE